MENGKMIIGIAQEKMVIGDLVSLEPSTGKLYKTKVRDGEMQPKAKERIKDYVKTRIEYLESHPETEEHEACIGWFWKILDMVEE